MNIVYLHSHDTGRWITPYGHPHPTPNFTRLAEQGVLFENAFTVHPTCSPSRAALLTGRRPQKNGMIGLAHRGARLVDPSQHIASRLCDRGYTTALSGMQHVFRGEQLTQMPYDHVLAEVGVDNVAEADPAIARAAANFIEQPHDRPFFLSCGFFSTHRTKGHTDQRFNADASPLGDPDSTTVPAPLPDKPQTRSDVADFNVSLDRLDACVGTVLDAIDRSGRAEDTLVICTTDHGVPFPGHKCQLTDDGTGVLLILRGPGFCGGQRIKPMVTHLDIVPTICEVVGIEVGADLDGKALQPLVKGDVDRLHEAVFTEVNYHAAYEPMRAVRTEDFLLVRRYGPMAECRVLPNCDPGPSRDALVGAGWDRERLPREALYDVPNDPHGGRDLVGEADVAEAHRDLVQRLDDFLRSTGDPLAKQGHVPPPPGLKTTPAEASYPGDPTIDAASLFVDSAK